MPAMAVTIAPDGWLTDVDLGDPDLRPGHLRSLIGCAAVNPIMLATDLLMWVADPADDIVLNVAATDLVMTTANLPNRTIYGTVVCTGPFVDDADITPIPAGWARYLASHQAVQPVDAPVPPDSGTGPSWPTRSRPSVSAVDRLEGGRNGTCAGLRPVGCTCGIHPMVGQPTGFRSPRRGPAAENPRRST